MIWGYAYSWKHPDHNIMEYISALYLVTLNPKKHDQFISGPPAAVVV